MSKQLCHDLEIFTVALDRLQPHPLNVRIYGQEQPDPELVMSIRKVGLLDPLIVSPLPNKSKYVVVSGTRRLAALYKLHRTVARVRVVENLTDLETELALIEANRHREKTKEQRGREFIETKRIQAALARERQATSTGGKQPQLVAKLPPAAERGKARDKAAKIAGLKPRTAEKLAKVIKAADSGNGQARESLDAINKGQKSVSAAYNDIAKPALTDLTPFQLRTKRILGSILSGLRSLKVELESSTVTPEEFKWFEEQWRVVNTLQKEFAAVVQGGYSAHPRKDGGSRPTLSLQFLWVELCPFAEIDNFVATHHYTHSTNGITPEYSFKITDRRNGRLVGAAIFGIPGQKQTLDKYSEKGKYRLVELRRLVLLDEAPKNSETRVLSHMLHLLRKEGVQRILSYADPNEKRANHPDGKHTGLIYRAAGFHTVRESGKTKAVWWNGRRYPLRNLDQYNNYYRKPDGKMVGKLNWDTVPENKKILRHVRTKTGLRPVWVIKLPEERIDIARKLHAALKSGEAEYRTEDEKIGYVKDLQKGMRYYETPRRKNPGGSGSIGKGSMRIVPSPRQARLNEIAEQEEIAVAG